MVRRWFSITFLLAGASGAGGEPVKLHHYNVAIDENLSTLQVRACFAGATPSLLVAGSLDAAGALEAAVLQGTKKVFEPNGAELHLGSLPDSSCIAYRVNLAQFRGGHERGGAPTLRVGTDLLTDLRVWFWRPGSLGDDEDIEIRFDLPASISASVPWPTITTPEGRRAYRAGHGPYDWPAAVAFGHFAEHVVEVPGGELHVAVLDGRPRVNTAQITQSIQQAAHAVSQLYGRFPVASAQILVIPGARGNGPVPVAYVLRGGGPAPHFFINQRRPMEDFRTDWTMIHELSHLLLPYVRSEDAWLSEGTATYYQNVLRARSGIIDAREAWQSLNGGFVRGMNSLPGVTLAEATEHMYRSGDFSRVYWEGAAIMLLADQRLRARTAGEQSLDTALEQLQRCCLSAEIGWRAVDLFDKLDELTATSVFSELYQAYVHFEAWPDVAEAYRLLGLRVNSSGEITLTNDAPQLVDRDAIMTGPAPPVAGSGTALQR